MYRGNKLDISSTAFFKVVEIWCQKSLAFANKITVWYITVALH